MEEERCKELMEQVGMPNSISLKVVLEQVENETEQRMQSENARLKEDVKYLTKYNDVAVDNHLKEEKKLKQRIKELEHREVDYALTISGLNAENKELKAKLEVAEKALEYIEGELMANRSIKLVRAYQRTKEALSTLRGEVVEG